jgi:hypothetical protein
MNASRIRREWLVIASRGFRRFAFLGLEFTSRASTRYNMLPTTVSETPGKPSPEPANAQRFHRSVEPPAFPPRFSRSTADAWSTSQFSGFSGKRMCLPEQGMATGTMVAVPSSTRVLTGCGSCTGPCTLVLTKRACRRCGCPRSRAAHWSPLSLPCGKSPLSASCSAWLSSTMGRGSTSNVLTPREPTCSVCIVAWVHSKASWELVSQPLACFAADDSAIQ